MIFGRGMLHNGGWYGYMHSGWNWLIAVGILLLIVSVTYLLVKRNKTVRSSSSAIERLKVKFALGEITEEDYRNRRTVLEEK